VTIPDPMVSRSRIEMATDRLPAAAGWRLRNFLSSDCRHWAYLGLSVVTLRRNVTKVQLPHLHLRNLTMASQTLDWLLEA